jgi:hypothetical protein
VAPDLGCIITVVSYHGYDKEIGCFDHPGDVCRDLRSGGCGLCEAPVPNLFLVRGLGDPAMSVGAIVTR